MALPRRKPSYPFKSVTGDGLAHERLADQIRDAIFEKKLLPGGKLPTERDLARIVQTSRVTVRSALLTLKNGVVWKNDHKERILLHHRRIAQKVQAKAPEEAREAMSEHLLDMQRILAELPHEETGKGFKF